MELQNLVTAIKKSMKYSKYEAVCDLIRFYNDYEINKYNIVFGDVIDYPGKITKDTDANSLIETLIGIYWDATKGGILVRGKNYNKPPDGTNTLNFKTRRFSLSEIKPGKNILKLTDIVNGSDYLGALRIGYGIDIGEDDILISDYDNESKQLALIINPYSILYKGDLLIHCIYDPIGEEEDLPSSLFTNYHIDKNIIQMYNDWSLEYQPVLNQLFSKELNALNNTTLTENLDFKFMFNEPDWGNIDLTPCDSTIKVNVHDVASDSIIQIFTYNQVENNQFFNQYLNLETTKDIVLDDELLINHATHGLVFKLSDIENEIRTHIFNNALFIMPNNNFYKIIYDVELYNQGVTTYVRAMTDLKITIKNEFFNCVNEGFTLQTQIRLVPDGIRTTDGVDLRVSGNNGLNLLAY